MSRTSPQEDMRHPSGSLQYNTLEPDLEDSLMIEASCPSSRPSSEVGYLMPSALSMADISERPPVHTNVAAQFSKVESASLRVPQTMERSSYNTDYAKDEDMKSSSMAYGEPQMPASSNVAEAYEHQDLHHADMHQIPSVPRNHLSSPYLLQFGAQFDSGDSDYNDDDDEEDLIAPAPSITVVDRLNPAARFKSNPRYSLGAITPTAALQDLNFTEILAKGDRVFQKATLEKEKLLNDLLGAEPLVYGIRRPGIVVTDPLGRPTIPLADDSHIPSLEDESTTPKTLVEQTLGLVHSLNKLWLPKLASDQDLYSKCSIYPPAILFKLGVQTLQRCYCGTLPSSFEALFAFMHVAFAFSRVIYEDDGSYYWDGFSQDAYCWHYTISDPKEANLFVRVWYQLWRPRGTMEIHEQDNSTSNAALLTTSCATGNESTSSMPEVFGRPSNLDCTDQNLVMPQALMIGMVIKGCSRFLDTLEYVYYIMRNAANPAQFSSTYQLGLIEAVTQPLRHCRAMEICDAHIENINAKLRSGHLHNVRELEVTLISCPELYQLPPQIHSRYLDDVASRCDEVERRSDSSWRYEYYNVDLTLVLKLFADLDPRRYSTCHTRSPPQPADGTPNFLPQGSSEKSPLLNRVYSGAHSASSPLPPVGFGASASTNHSWSSTQNTFPTTLQTSIPLDPTNGSVTSSDGSFSSTQSTSFTTCRLCPGKTFEGTSTNQRRNWKRHMTSEHGDGLRLPCLEVGCSVTVAAGRFDNLKRHVKQQHESALSSSSSTRKRKVDSLA